MITKFFIIAVLTCCSIINISTSGKHKMDSGFIHSTKIEGNNFDSSKWKWPDSLDAVKAAPKSHHVIFENDEIRILEVTLLPYANEPMHTHRWPGVMFGNNNGDTSSFDIIYYRYDLNPLTHKYFVKDSIRQHNDGSQQNDSDEGSYMNPEGPHSIKNLSNVKIDVYRVEFKHQKK